MPFERIRGFVTEKHADVSFTLIAAAREYRQTRALEKMTPKERERYYIRRENGEEMEAD